MGDIMTFTLFSSTPV